MEKEQRGQRTRKEQVAKTTQRIKKEMDKTRGVQGKMMLEKYANGIQFSLMHLDSFEHLTVTVSRTVVNLST